MGAAEEVGAGWLAIVGAGPVSPVVVRFCTRSVSFSSLKVLPWVVDGAGGLGAGKTSGAGTRGVDLNAAIGGRTGDSDTNGGESSNNGSKIHVECYPAENPSL